MEVQEHALKRPSPLKGPKSPLQLSPAVVAHSPPPAASPPPPHTHHTHTLTTHTLHTHAHRKLFDPARRDLQADWDDAEGGTPTRGESLVEHAASVERAEGQGQVRATASELTERRQKSAHGCTHAQTAAGSTSGLRFSAKDPF